MVYYKKSPDSPALSQFQLSAIPAIPLVIPGPAASASAALQGGAAAARGPEILPDRSTFVEPRGAQAEDASGEQGNEREGGGKVSSLHCGFFLVGWRWKWGMVFSLFRKFDGKKSIDV